jgi:hypothetical protein
VSDDTLVIGDVHGHFDRLTLLLEQEGILSHDGKRLRPEVNVIQLGDLGHNGVTRDAGPPKVKSPTADFWCYELVGQGIIDLMLWGNHDRAVIDSWHAYGGYTPPPMETKHLLKTLQAESRLVLAAEAHGFLLTHAGLHKQFKHNDVPEEWKTDPASLAAALNDFDRRDSDEKPIGADVALQAIRDAIGTHRGGRSPYGGILWRDAGESLFEGYRQIFGHSAKDKMRKYQTPLGYSYCIDIGSPTNGDLMGMWLPSETPVTIHVAGPPLI